MIKIPPRKGPQLTEDQLAKATGVLNQHRAFVTSESFWAVRDAVMRRCPFKPGVQDTAHAQHWADGYRAGYESALTELQTLAVEESSKDFSTGPVREPDFS
jgi:hypothetical protein